MKFISPLKFFIAGFNCINNGQRFKEKHNDQQSLAINDQQSLAINVKQNFRPWFTLSK